MSKNYHLNNWYYPALEFEGIQVSQIGRLYCNPDTVISTHQHTDLYELTVVTEGEGTITTNGTPIPVKRGDIYLSLPCDSHRIDADSKDPLKFDFFAFQCDIPYIHQELEKISANYHGANMRIFRNEQIRHLISSSIAELTQETKYSKVLLASIFRQILIYTIRGFDNIQPEAYPETITNADVLCYKLMNYIDTHIYTIKNLTILSATIGYSYGYLSSVFKKTTGETLSDYCCRRKLETARLLLLEDRMKITQIAEMLNYSSVYALSKAFTRRYGVSPRNYRKNTMQSDRQPIDN